MSGRVLTVEDHEDNRRIVRDLLTSVGGYPGDEDKARDAFGKIDQAKAREDFVAALLADAAMAVQGSGLGDTIGVGGDGHSRHFPRIA